MIKTPCVDFIELSIDALRESCYTLPHTVFTTTLDRGNAMKAKNHFVFDYPGTIDKPISSFTLEISYGESDDDITIERISYVQAAHPERVIEDMREEIFDIYNLDLHYHLRERLEDGEDLETQEIDLSVWIEKQAGKFKKQKYEYC